MGNKKYNNKIIIKIAIYFPDVKKQNQWNVRWLSYHKLIKY